MLYNILNLLAECYIPFVFLSSSMKFDVIDNFEKRIKSRCSQRTVLLYDLNLDKFNDQVSAVLLERKENLALRQVNGQKKQR